MGSRAFSWSEKPTHRDPPRPKHKPKWLTGTVLLGRTGVHLEQVLHQRCTDRGRAGSLWGKRTVTGTTPQVDLPSQVPPVQITAAMNMCVTR